MNRSILIVICDFLLVSLVVFTTVDVNKLSDAGPREMKLELATNRVDSGKDLTAVMQMALADELRNRNRLLSELATTRDSLTRQQSLLGERDKQVKGVQQELAELEKRLDASQQELAARDQRLLASQQELAERDKKVQAYQQELTARQQLGAQLAQQQAALQGQLAAAQASLTNLGQQLHDNTVQSVISGERLAAFEDLLSKQAVLQSSNILQQLAALAKTNDAVLAERVRLGTQLAAAETEKRVAAEQVSRMQGEVKIEREEKARLAEGVKELAARSGDIAREVRDNAREVRDNRSLAPNSIFSEVVTNRVQARFSAVRKLLFGQTSKDRETETVLVSDGSRIYALCHVHDTPLTLWEPGTDWEGLTGTLNRGTASCPIRSVSFCLADPRVILIPVSAEDAARLGCKVYRVSTDPYKFQDAVLVGTRADYYGECRFQIDLSTLDYVKLDRSFLKGLIGKFNPSRGDLVFSKTGEMLGVMANASYCLMLRDFSFEATMQFGDDIRAQHTGATLSALYSHLLTMPFKLQ
jgi:peptidoglycan hydrolase CwlO-like protein